MDKCMAATWDACCNYVLVLKRKRDEMNAEYMPNLPSGNKILCR